MSTGMGNSKFDAYRQWEIRFDAALKEADNKDAREAWNTLRARGCDGRCLKGALFYAAQKLEVAQEIRHLSEFSKARDAILKQLPELHKTVKPLATPAVQGRQVASLLSSVWGLKKSGARTLERFPSVLEEVETVLKAIRVPRFGKPDIAAYAEIARGEVLLHIYVEDITGRSFCKETAALFAASADAYGLDDLRSYDPYSSQRRYRRWFHDKKDSDCEELRRRVAHLKHDPDNFLKNFVDGEIFETAFVFGMKAAFEAALLGPTRRGRNGKPQLVVDPLKAFRRIVRSSDRQSKPPAA